MRSPPVQSPNPTLTTYGSLIRLKPEYEERYIILHRHTFPGVLERIRKCNIRNYTIFLRDGILFSHFEYTGLDFPADMSAMGDDVTREWWKLTEPMQEPLEERNPGEWWASMERFLFLRTEAAGGSGVRRGGFVSSGHTSAVPMHRGGVGAIEDDLKEIAAAHGVRTVALYGWRDQMYCYCEASRDSFEKDLGGVLMSSLRSGTGSSFREMFSGMREVFHTD
jgi:L-rhamnose mutarotase